MANPKLIPVPFANGGAKTTIPIARASNDPAEMPDYNEGFPPITSTPVTAGGKAPRRPDFNGILNDITANIRHVNSGGFFTFDAEFAAKVGGYPKGAILLSNDGSKKYVSLIDGNTSNFNTTLDPAKWAKAALTEREIQDIAWGTGKIESPWLSRSGGTLTGALYADGGSGAGTGIKGDLDQDTGWEWPSDGVLQAIVNGGKRVEFNAISGATSLWTHNGYKLVLQTDGNLAWYNASSVVLWSSNGTYSKTDTDSRYAKLAGAVMQGVFCAQSGTGVSAGIKASGDNDTGFEWPAEGVMQELVDSVIRSKTSSSDQSRRFYNGGFETTLQSDGNIVVRNSANALVSDLYSRAPLGSPALIGVPTAPTASIGTRSTQLATTAFVGAESQIAAPTGSVYTFAGSTVPTGWLKCNGALLSRTTYASLFAAIGTAYGAGDGSTTFSLPDLRGEFLRGLDDARGVDSGRVIGSAQGDAIRNITATLNDFYGGPSMATDGAFISTGVLPNGGGANSPSSRRYTNTFDASRVVPTAAENRPRNVAMHYIIKY